MNTAIIVAAGSGTRFSGSQSKQFVSVLGKPVIIHTLEKFDACPDVDEIILVLSDKGRREFAEIANEFKIAKLRTIGDGGKIRAESVLNGLRLIEPATANIVAIHDGARPLVSVDEISRTIQMAAEKQAGCLVADLTDTIKQIDGETIVSTVNRSNLRRALTPQTFEYELLMNAFNNYDLTDEITDECYLLEKMGVEIAVVQGSSRNIKITRRDDLILMETFLKLEGEGR